MKFSIFFILFIGVLIHSAHCQTNIQVQVTGISSQKGEIFAALYSSEKGFPSDAARAFKTAKAMPSEGKATLNFTQIPEGTYAIALFHDNNGDGKLNTNFLGIPKEGYGVSNNVRNLFSAPGFDESSFKVGKSAVKLTIKVQY
jgi:uncharacterized protein (DUF2141 family)